ncbi:hypothetical protein [Legionella gresilensis]|uniref:hypothetical protein n=1 Tax=Legionella gresilensis TaxID=91823 RepID=UPI0010417D7D|nr:hypothetical protein [Legionella gresilensis]
MAITYPTEILKGLNKHELKQFLHLSNQNYQTFRRNLFRKIEYLEVKERCNEIFGTDDYYSGLDEEFK